jgi:hypothetical protein
MKPSAAWHFCTFLMVLTLLAGPQFITQASQAGAYLYTRATPSVIYADGQDSTTLEVFTTNQNVAEVSLKSYYQENWQILYDNGTHGDRTAGDGVFTLDGVTTEMLPPDMWLFDGRAGSADFDVQIIYSNGQPADFGYAHLRVVDPGVEFPAEQTAPGMVASEYALFVSDPQGQIFNGEPYPAVDQYIDLSTATRMFYDVYPDEFDFLVVMPMHPNYRPTYEYSEGPVPFATTVRAAAQNIGVDDYYIDTTIDYGSAERLLSVIYHSADYGSVLTHEIGHTWSAFIGDDELQDQQYMTAHWDANSDLGGIMGMYVTPYTADPATEMERSSMGLPVNFNLQVNPDGSFRLVDAHGYKQFIPLDLYLMGLIPAEDIPPVHMLTNPDFSNLEHVTAQEVKTYTSTELVDMAGGPRLPAYPEARRDFNIGFVFFSDQEFSEAEVAWGTMVAREVTLKESDSINTFYRATRGLATLNARLADWGIPDLSVSPDSTTTAADTPTVTSPPPIATSPPTQAAASTIPPIASTEQPSPEPGRPVWNENIPCVSILSTVPFFFFATLRKNYPGE